MLQNNCINLANAQKYENFMYVCLKLYRYGNFTFESIGRQP